MCTAFGVYLEHQYDIATRFSPDVHLAIELANGTVTPLPFQEEIVISYVSRRNGGRLVVKLDGVDITDEMSEHSKGRTVFCTSNSPSIANLLPAEHKLLAEIVDANNQVMASKTVSFTTVFHDSFDNLDPRVWREEGGIWISEGGKLTGKPIYGAKVASLMSEYSMVAILELSCGR